MKNNNLIYTPNYKIPIGEPIIKEDGKYAIRIKRHNSPEYDDIPLDNFYNEVITKAKMIDC